MTEKPASWIAYHSQMDKYREAHAVKDHAASPSYPDGVRGPRAYICRYCGEPIHATSRTLTSFRHGKRKNDRDFRN